jgi:hypothetical protein
MRRGVSSRGFRRACASALGLALLAGAATPVAAIELVPRGATWRYLDDGSDQGTAWKEVLFVDTGWPSGKAQLGYGDGDQDTNVGFGPDRSNKYITTYFRHTFQVADPGALIGLALRLLRDDGAVVYLNGTEVYRDNMPAGAIDYLTLASGPIDGPPEDALVDVALDPGAIVPGDNVLAVEIHQVTVLSSDISFDLELSTGPPTVLRGPYLQLGTPDSIVVRWRTDLATASRVRFGPAPNDLSTTVTEPGPTHDHEVEITGLAASTRYFYAVGTDTETLAGEDVDHFFVTSPPPGTRQPLRIWAIGDSGKCGFSQVGCDDAGAVADAYLGFAGGELADVWLMLGDNAYGHGTENEHTAAIFDTYPHILRNTVLWPSPGNHEFASSDSPTQTGPYYEAFTLPTAGQAGGWPSGTEAYYSFDVGNVHFVALDSHDTDRSAPADPTVNICPAGEGGAMYQWLCTDLAATDQDWVIAYWHHPPYSKGSHDSDDPADSGGRLQEMRERFLPVLENFGVDLTLTGHSHSYERSMLIDGHYGPSSTFGPEYVVDGGDGSPEPGGGPPYWKPTLGMAPHEGAVHAVVGSSSQVGGGPLDHPVMAVSIADLGSLVVDVDGDRLDAYWIDDTGTVRDHFRIGKGSTAVPSLSPWALASAAAALIAGALPVLRRARSRPA